MNRKRPSQLPIIIVTGASGLTGRHFVKSFYDGFYIYAIARRSQKQGSVPINKNINWIRCDIGKQESVENLFQDIADKGGADFIIHLAGFYDFDGKDSLEYERTNVKGTQYNLEAIISLGYRINSERATNFRRWATRVLKNFTIRGYVLDDMRLKNGAYLSKQYFKDLGLGKK